MKKFLKDFCKRGMAFAWGGPVIMAIIWLCLQASGTVSELTVNQVALGIFSTTIMAFIAAGISVVYQMENLPKPFAVLIQASVLYIDYLGIYLLNGWLPTDADFCGRLRCDLGVHLHSYPDQGCQNEQDDEPAVIASQPASGFLIMAFLTERFPVGFIPE